MERAEELAQVGLVSPLDGRTYPRRHVGTAPGRSQRGAVAGGHVENALAGLDVDGLAQRFTDYLQGCADHGVVARRPTSRSRASSDGECQPATVREARPQNFLVGSQVSHRFGADDHFMRNKSVLETVVRGAIAVATSVLTGAGAGALLARKPILVPVQQRHQPYGRVVR